MCHERWASHVVIKRKGFLYLSQSVNWGRSDALLLRCTRRHWCWSRSGYVPDILADLLIDLFDDWLTDWLTDRLTDRETDRQTDRQTDWPSDWLTDWLIDWPIDLTDCYCCCCCFLQLYSFQLGQHQTWQTWPETASLQQFLKGGQGDAVLELTITLMMSKVSSEVTQVSVNVDSAHTSLIESMKTLRSSLRDYNSSTVIDDTFVRYASCYCCCSEAVDIVFNCIVLSCCHYGGIKHDDDYCY